MKKSVKMASLAALTAAIIALPAAAGAMHSSNKCHPKTSMHKCGAKCSAKMGKCGAKCQAKCGAKCAAKCGAKPAAKCAPKSKCGTRR